MNITNSSSFILRTNTVNAYLRDINKVKILTKQEEIDLFKALQESKERLESVKENADMFSRDEYNSIVARETKIQDDIRNEVIMRNQRFVFAVAKRYDNKDGLMDLVNVANIGMYEAFEKFEYKEGNRFCSFAIWFIRRAINAYLVKDNLTVRTTNNTRYLPKVKKIENKFFMENGRKPSPNEIINLMEEIYGIKDITIDDITFARVDSIDASYSSDDEDYTLEDTSDYAAHTASYNDYETNINNDALAVNIKEALNSLPERERIIICMSTGYGYSQEYKDYEIAKVLNLTSERVRQLRHSATKKFASIYNPNVR